MISTLSMLHCHMTQVLVTSLSLFSLQNKSDLNCLTIWFCLSTGEYTCTHYLEFLGAENTRDNYYVYDSKDMELNYLYLPGSG